MSSLYFNGCALKAWFTRWECSDRIYPSYFQVKGKRMFYQAREFADPPFSKQVILWTKEPAVMHPGDRQVRPLTVFGASPRGHCGNTSACQDPSNSPLHTAALWGSLNDRLPANQSTWTPVTQCILVLHAHVQPHPPWTCDYYGCQQGPLLHLKFNHQQHFQTPDNV